MEYIGYLNSISIQEIWTSSPISWDNTQEQIIDEMLLEEALLEAELSWSLDEDYSFLPETEDTTSFGFSWSLDTEISSWTDQQTPSVTKEDLVNLIKSKEQ